MKNVAQIIKNGFYKIRDWYDPMITSVSKPMVQPGGNFYPTYVFTVHYGEKSEPVVVCSDDPANWIGKTPENVAWDLYNYYVAKMRKQQKKR